MKLSHKSSLIIGCLLAGAASTNAGQVALYDLGVASGTSLASTSTVAPFTASPLVLFNASNGASAFGNHFYHNGWGTTLNTSKYYQNTLAAGGNPFTFDATSITFSLENTGGSSSVTLRSNLDNYSTDIAGASWNNADVTNFSFGLSGLGVISNSITFRWYMTSSNGSVVGFANHESPGAGSGLPDVGQDLRFFASPARKGVPDGASTIALLGAVLSGFAVVRRKINY